MQYDIRARKGLCGTFRILNRNDQQLIMWNVKHHINKTSVLQYQSY